MLFRTFLLKKFAENAFILEEYFQHVCIFGDLLDASTHTHAQQATVRVEG
jgi:hypothetical protein